MERAIVTITLPYASRARYRHGRTPTLPIVFPGSTNLRITYQTYNTYPIEAPPIAPSIADNMAIPTCRIFFHSSDFAAMTYMI